MINHLRTLLINDISSPGSDLEELISSDFRIIPLKAGELAIQRHLVPISFPRRTRNFLASVLSNIAKGHSHYESVLKLDPRALIVHPLDHTPLYAKTTITGVGGFSHIEMFGQIFPRPGVGFFSARWRLFRNSDTAISLVNKDTAEREVLSVTFNSDLSDIIALGDSGISFRVVGSSIVPDFEIDVESTCPIQFDIGSVVKHLRSDQWSTQVFDLKDKSLASDLQNDFLFSDTHSVAIGAILIAYALHVSERVYQ